MKRMLAVLAALAGLLFVAPAFAAAPAFVIDRASALGESTREELIGKLERIQASTGVEVRLVVVRSLEGRTAGAIARSYMSPGDHDQVVLLMAMRDRQVRAHTTVGLQERIPDQVWANMIASEMMPSLRAVRQATAARRGVDGLGDVLAGDYQPRLLATTGDISAIRDVGVVALVAILLALGLYPRTRARFIAKAKWS